MKMKHAAVMAGLALGLMSGKVEASYIVTFTQSDRGVLATGVGTFSSNPGTSITNSTLSGVSPSFPIFGFVPGQIDYFYPLRFEGPSSWGSGGYTDSDMSSGDAVEFYPRGLYLPKDYVGGSLLSSTAFFSQATLSSLGLNPGVYTYSGTFFGDQESVTVNVVSPVPLPTSATMFGAALLALSVVGYGLKPKSKAVAAA